MASNAFPPKIHPTGPKRPRLGVCSWSLQPSTPEELVERVRATGLDSVQLALTPLAERPLVWSTTGELLREAGIAILSGMLETVGEDYGSIESITRTGGVRPASTWPATRERAAKVALVARDLGVRLVTLHAGFLPHDSADPERATMLARLREVLALFGKHGIAVALETGQEPAHTLIACLEAIRSEQPRDQPPIGVNFDPANMLLYGSGDPIEALRLLAPWVAQIHLKDALPSPTPGSWGTEVPLGEGAVDWDRFFAEAAGCPRSPQMVIEREAGNRRVADVVIARELVAREMVERRGLRRD
jgi:L-ribulose-5-phosphate 3-epimerase